MRAYSWKQTWLNVGVAFFLVGVSAMGALMVKRTQQLRTSLVRAEAECRTLNLELLKARTRVVNLLRENRRLSRERAELPKLRGEVTMLRRELRDRVELPERIEKIKSTFNETPDAWIPGIDMLPGEVWARAATFPLDSEDDVLQAVGLVRKAAFRALAEDLRNALTLLAAKQETPTTLNELAPLTSEVFRDQLLEHCVMNQAEDGKQVISARHVNPLYAWSLEVDKDSYLYRYSNGYPRR